MLRRIKDADTGVVHFSCPAAHGMTLCARRAGRCTDDLFAKSCEDWKETKDLVSCPDCAKVYCAVKNEPWNTHVPFESHAFDVGMYAAVEKDGPVGIKETIGG